MIPSVSPATRPFIPRKITWTDRSPYYPHEITLLAPSIQQDFSLPASIIYYISKNPTTSKQYLKLVQCCKHFFEMLPLLVVDYVYLENYLSSYPPQVMNFVCLEELSRYIWLTKEVDYEAMDEEPDLAARLCSKLFRSDTVRLNLWSQKLMFEDFKFMASSAKEILIVQGEMVCENGAIATVDKILGSLDNVEKFECVCNPEMIGPSTFKNIAKLSNLSNLRHLEIACIPEIQNVVDLLAIKMKHEDVQTEFSFAKDGDEFKELSEEFKNQLDAVVDFIIKEGISNCLIQYYGIDAEKEKIMFERFDELEEEDY